jgi:hypothetical protein
VRFNTSPVPPYFWVQYLQCKGARGPNGATTVPSKGVRNQHCGCRSPSLVILATTIAQPAPHQQVEAEDDQHHDSKEEIEAVIEDEPARLRQENEHLWLVQEHMARRMAVMKRIQIMQHQIKQERAWQVELQQAIDDLHQ